MEYIVEECNRFVAHAFNDSIYTNNEYIAINLYRFIIKHPINYYILIINQNIHKYSLKLLISSLSNFDFTTHSENIIN